MAAFTGSSKLRSIKGEKICGVKFVFQLSREALVNQCTQHYVLLQEGIKSTVPLGSDYKIRGMP